MNIDNIFDFVQARLPKNPRTENRLSISFGFILHSDQQVFTEFLKELKLPNSKIRDVRIRTQESIEPYGITDLMIRKQNEFMVIIESKIIEHKPEYVSQLKNYADFLLKQRAYFPNIRLVYVTKRDLTSEETESIQSELKLEKTEFLTYSWQYLIDLSEKSTKKMTKMFNVWIGDMMNSIKKMDEQRIEDVVEVLAVYTKPMFFKLLKEKNIIVQNTGAADALYIAVIETHRKNGLPSAITHICKVKETKIETAKESWRGCKAKNEYIKWVKEEGWDSSLNWEHKVYVIDGEPRKLFREITMGGPKHQVSFKTTFRELVSKEFGKDMNRDS
ncbi:PD-(D/E)XK nuclease family protein [Candidatus Micrarchaeota archaeon]|nr:PD-(D/E)XK nuclease family protein [Candidatus Micrarchaeota archaeon]